VTDQTQTSTHGPAVEQIVELSDAELLKGMWTADDLRRQVDLADRHLWVAIADGEDVVYRELETQDDAEIGREVLGFTLTCVHTYEELDAELQVPVGELFDREDCPVGMFKSLVVKPSARDRRIGTELGLRAIGETFVEDDRVDEAIAVAWVREHNSANLALVETYGELVAEYDEYYGEGRDCPECPGENYCGCTFRIYRAPF
jgi:GNAT superfamily N-acetyltransferase